MDNRLILASCPVNQELTVPAGSSDIRLVAETNENHVVKRRGFRKRAKNPTPKVSDRPARRVKLNRRIFNVDLNSNPPFRVKTLQEIKNDKKSEQLNTSAIKVSDNTTTINNDRVKNSVTASVFRPESDCAVKLTGFDEIPVNAFPTSDSRTVIKRNNTKTLLLPCIQLKRISKDHYKRSFSNACSNAINTVMVQTLPQEDPHVQTPSKDSSEKKLRLKLPNAPSIQAFPTLINGSPSKKRKISPVRPPNSFTPQLPNDHVQPSVSNQQPPSPLDSPPSLDSLPSPFDNSSPALSLERPSDNDFEHDSRIKNSHLIIMSEPAEATTIQKSKFVYEHSKKPNQSSENNAQISLLSLSGQDRNITTTHAPQKKSCLGDDILDVMSVIADDDELFVENKPGKPLTRSTSQESISNIPVEKKKQRNVISVSKQTPDDQAQLVCDLIANKPLSPCSLVLDKSNTTSNSSHFTQKSKVKCQSDNYMSNFLHADTQKNISFHGHSLFPQPIKVISNDSQPLNGFTAQKKICSINRSINRSLAAGNVSQAWALIKKLDNNKSFVGICTLEETIKVCEIVSVNRQNAVVAEISTDVFKMLEQRKALKPMSYFLTVLTLCRCGKFKEAFGRLSAMIDAKVFPPEDFFQNLIPCLSTEPRWIFELLRYIKRFSFSNPTHLVNNCLASLVDAPVNLLREIPAKQWDVLIEILSFPPNVQGAMQVQNIMDQQCIAISDQSLLKLLHLYRDTKCTKQLLDLVHSKCSKDMFGVDSVLTDDTLKLGDIEAHIRDLIKRGSLPRETVLHHFIEKASSFKEFQRVYNVFMNCKNSQVSLSESTLKKMVEVLENWEDNLIASVEVYAALQHGKALSKKEHCLPSSNQPQNSPKVSNCQPVPCRFFRKTGTCFYGDRCKFSHQSDKCPPHLNLRSNTLSHSSLSKSSKCTISNGSQPHNGKLPNGFFGVPGEAPKSKSSNNIQQNNANDCHSTSSPLMNGHSLKKFPSFQDPTNVVPMFNSLQNDSIPRFPQPLRQPLSTRPCFQPARFASPPSKSPIRHLISKPVHTPARSHGTDNVNFNPSFLCEHLRNTKPHGSPLTCFHQPNPSNEKNDTMKVSSKIHQRLDQALITKNWSDVYLCYVERKEASRSIVQANDLKMFRNMFLKDVNGAGLVFCEFVDFIHKEKSSIKSSNSDGGSNSPFDEYDTKFLGSVGVSLMEKYSVSKKFEIGYSILHILHAFNINYFDCGKNFGVYTRDIPPSAVALIAIKLCMGLSQENGLLGAVEVLRASNYAMPEEKLAQDHSDYRIKVLQNLFVKLYDGGNISEAYEIVQHLEASQLVMVQLYAKVLRYYVSMEDFDQSFCVLTEMKENGFNLNISECQSLYETFLKLCIANGQDEEALTALKEMETQGILLNGDVWQCILNLEPATMNETLTSMLFQRCLDLGVYPSTFSTEMPWLFELGCGYSRREVRLLIVNHLEQLNKYLVESTQSVVTVSSIKDFQIVQFPRLSNGSEKCDEGIQATIIKNGLIVKQVVEEDLNPPLIIASQKHEQFHSEFIVETLSLYRWFIGNHSNNNNGDNVSDEKSLDGSIESCVSYMTRITEFD